MFINFFFELRRAGVPVTINEWMMLHDALGHGLAESNLETFYHLARSILVKNETYFDRYDRVFKHFFEGIETSDEIVDEILKGLEQVDPLILTEAEKRLLQALPLEEVLENFRRQFEEGHYKQHVGGDRAIGTGGRSTQGAFGYNPAGIRIGQGYSRHGSAIQIAEKRYFRNYSSDMVLDTRQIRVALSKLRTLLPVGPEDELDIDTTVDKTCRNAGELEISWMRGKKNKIKLLLLMDVGGSMEPYHWAVSKLFSAAKSQIKDMKSFYFHNCIYQDLWKDIERNDNLATPDFLKQFENDYKIIFVGDASMAPSELLDANGAIDYFYRNEEPGIWWMYRLMMKFPGIVWLNPMRKRTFQSSVSGHIIAKMFPMFELTLDGLDDAMKTLLKPKRPKITAQEIQQIINHRNRPYARNW
ncbi:MAG: VWA domain-containing protein [bacterium]